MVERLGFRGVRVHGVDAFTPPLGSRSTILLFRFAGGENEPVEAVYIPYIIIFAGVSEHVNDLQVEASLDVD